MSTIVVALLIGLPLAAIVCFAAWIRRTDALSPDERVKYWDVFLKALAALVAASGGSIAVLRYLDDRNTHEQQQFVQREEELTRAIERDGRERIDKLTGLYDRLGKAVTALLRAPSPETPQGQTARAEFDELYWFSLIGVEDQAVEAAMIRLRTLLDADDQAGIRTAVLGLATVCKRQVDAERQRLREEVGERHRFAAGAR